MMKTWSKEYLDNLVKSGCVTHVLTEEAYQKLEKAIVLEESKLEKGVSFNSRNNLEKAKKDLSRLAARRVSVTRDGKTFMQTVYVKVIEDPKTGKQIEHLMEHGKKVKYEKGGQTLSGHILSVTFNDKTDKYGTARIKSDDGAVHSVSLNNIKHGTKAGKTSIVDSSSKKMTWEEVLADKEGRAMADSIDEYIADIDSGSNNKSHIEGLEDTLKMLEEKTGYKHEYGYKKLAKYKEEPQQPDSEKITHPAKWNISSIKKFITDNGGTIVGTSKNYGMTHIFVKNKDGLEGKITNYMGSSMEPSMISAVELGSKTAYPVAGYHDLEKWVKGTWKSNAVNKVSKPKVKKAPLAVTVNKIYMNEDDSVTENYAIALKDFLGKIGTDGKELMAERRLTGGMYHARVGTINLTFKNSEGKNMKLTIKQGYNTTQYGSLTVSNAALFEATGEGSAMKEVAKVDYNYYTKDEDTDEHGRIVHNQVIKKDIPNLNWHKQHAKQGESHGSYESHTQAKALLDDLLTALEAKK